MILIGAYADSFREAEPGKSQLTDLGDLIDQVLPGCVGVHLLSFLPSAGDWGFAPNEWRVVREEVGTWADLRSFASRRRIVVDAIYNHVGMRHPLVRSLFSPPHVHEDIVYAFRTDDELVCPTSPRGGPVLRRHLINGEVWQIWQTFSLDAVDIRLDHPRVEQEIERHLELLTENQVWGIRLDAPAYYAKFLAQSQLHHAEAYRLARKIARAAIGHGLAVTAQLDCDDPGMRYFARDDFDVPVVDYAFSAQLLLAMLTADVGFLVEHLRDTWLLPCTVLRAPRTHDGILLRSPSVLGAPKELLIERAARAGVGPRIIDGDRYEFNASLPYMYSTGVGVAEMQARVDLSLALSCLVPGWSYLYFPYLLGYLPEREHRPVEEDPRALNRQPMSRDFRRQYLESRNRAARFVLLDALGTIRNEVTGIHGAGADWVDSPQAGVLRITRPDSNVLAVFNFDSVACVDIRDCLKGDLLVSRRVSGTELRPLGFAVWRF